MCHRIKPDSKFNTIILNYSAIEGEKEKDISLLFLKELFITSAGKLVTPIQQTYLELTYENGAMPGWITKETACKQDIDLVVPAVCKIGGKAIDIISRKIQLEAGYHLHLIPSKTLQDYLANPDTTCFVVAKLSDILFFDGNTVSVKKFLIPDTATLDMIKPTIKQVRPKTKQNNSTARLILKRNKEIIDFLKKNN